MANAAERVTAVFRLLEQNPLGLSAIDVAEALSVTRAASSRLLSLMVESDLLERDPKSQKYVLSLSLWATSSTTLRHLPLLDLSFLPMADAVRRSGLHLMLAVNRGMDTLFLRRVERLHDYVLVNPEGRRAPIHLLATGKAILAYDTPAAIEAYLQHDLKWPTDEGRTAEDLRHDLTEIRGRGYARNFGEGEPRDRGLAVPILDSDSHAVAGLGTSLPLGSEETQVIPVLGEVARLISRSLGYAHQPAISLP